jgi:pyroglutamyl-peptidase
VSIGFEIVKPPVRTVLVTGFEPFDGAEVNPTLEIARQLHGRRIRGHSVIGVVLPCRFGAAITKLKRSLRMLNPVLVVCVGQAGGRAEITPERIAINVDDARIPDNAGRQPVDTPVVTHGPTAYWSTLPIKAIVTALRRRGIPAAVSQTAGTFVCNHVFYGLMHALRRRPGVRGGFVHVPFLPEQALPGQPSLHLDMMIKAIGETVAVSLRTKRDLRTAGGQTH